MSCSLWAWLATGRLSPRRIEATSHRIDYKINAEVLPKPGARLVNILKCQHEVPSVQMRLGEAAVDHVREQRIGDSSLSIVCAVEVNFS